MKKVLSMLVTLILLGSATIATTTSAVAANRDQIMVIQQYLLDNGYDPNGVDGAIGNGTRTAAQDFLEENPDFGLPELSAETADKWYTILRANQLCGSKYDSFSSKIEGAEGTLLGIYNGFWGGDLEHTLVLSSVNNSGQYFGYYANEASGGIDSGCYTFRARASDDADLQISFRGIGAEVKYRMTDGESGELEGEYIIGGNTTPGIFSRLQ